ncbi:MAG: triose-phosphate isomerase [Acidobacteriota bacterium]
MTHRTAPLVVANWKMNLDGRVAEDLARAIVASPAVGDRSVEVLLAPPFPYLERVAAVVRGTQVGVAGQDLHWEEAGPFTGAVSGSMLADTGATHVLVGHSERRERFGDDDEAVKRKHQAARRAGLDPILCVGESLASRDAGQATNVVLAQIDAVAPGTPTIIAYEPIWAIGTGRVATITQAAEIHAAIRRHLGAGARVLYGGSVTPDNAGSLLSEPEIDGILVGSASLAATSFLDILAAAGTQAP